MLCDYVSRIMFFWRHYLYAKTNSALNAGIKAANTGPTKDRGPSKLLSYMKSAHEASQKDYCELLIQTNKKSVVSNIPHRGMTLRAMEFAYDLKLDVEYEKETTCCLFNFGTALGAEFSKNFENKPQALDKFLSLKPSGWLTFS